MTPEEKKAWAEDLLRQKYVELGRLPTKKDFDSASCAQIKAPGIGVCRAETA